MSSQQPPAESSFSILPSDLPPPVAERPPELLRSRPRGKKTLPRLVSLDAFRGFIMLVLAAHGFGISQLARTPAESPLWKILHRPSVEWLAFHFNHPPWQSSFVPGIHDATLGSAWLHVGVSFWDLIQPAFMFMVGVALPFSLARRDLQGERPWRRGWHALMRSIVLVLMGVFLYSLGKDSTNWIFPNVLAQIGLGYFFVFLMTNRRLWIQLLAFTCVLVGTWLCMHLTPPPADYQPELVNAQRERGDVFAPPYRQWSKNGNAFSTFDRWFLNLFPRPEKEGKFEFNSGGYQTLNFIPSIATMMLGMFCGQVLRSEVRPGEKFLFLFVLAIVLWGLGVAAGATCCPIVKRIWTPAWVLFSGGYVVGLLALFYLLFDVWPLQRLAFPLVVVGTNSLLVYFLGELLTGWIAENVQRHFGGAIEFLLGWLANSFHWLKNLDVPPAQAGEVMAQAFGPVIHAVSAVMIIWLICYWLYRQRVFLRI